MLWGTSLSKHGYQTISNFPFHSSQNGSVGWCSSTGDINNNIWSDSAIDGHWGNGLQIFFK